MVNRYKLINQLIGFSLIADILLILIILIYWAADLVRHGL